MRNFIWGLGTIFFFVFLVAVVWAGIRVPWAGAPEPGPASKEEEKAGAGTGAEAEAKAKQAAELMAKIKAEAEEKVRAAAEQKKSLADAKAKELAKIKAEAEANARIAAEERKAAAEAKAKEADELKARIKAEAEGKVRAAAEERKSLADVRAKARAGAVTCLSLLVRKYNIEAPVAEGMTPKESWEAAIKASQIPDENIVAAEGDYAVQGEKIRGRVIAVYYVLTEKPAAGRGEIVVPENAGEDVIVGLARQAWERSQQTSRPAAKNPKHL